MYINEYISKTYTGDPCANNNDALDKAYDKLVKGVFNTIKSYLPEAFRYVGDPIEDRTFTINSGYTYLKFTIDNIPGIYHYFCIYPNGNIPQNTGHLIISHFLSRDDISDGNDYSNSSLMQAQTVDMNQVYTLSSFYQTDSFVNVVSLQISFCLNIIKNDNTFIVGLSSTATNSNKNNFHGYVTVGNKKYIFGYRNSQNANIIYYFDREANLLYSSGLTYDLEGFVDPSKILAIPVYLSAKTDVRSQVDATLSPIGILECPAASCSMGAKYIIDGKLYYALADNILIED